VPSAVYDLHYLQAGTEQLEDYLLSGGGQRSLGIIAPKGEPAYPGLTLESLLLSQKRLQSQVLAPSLQIEFDALQTSLDSIRRRWRVHWEKKAEQGIQHRTKLWSAILDEIRRSPSRQENQYRYEVRLRVMIELLAAEACPADEQLKTLNGLDALLRSIFSPAPFVWPELLESAFPATVYWYLYGFPTSPPDRTPL
jgi:hypothetical protein